MGLWGWGMFRREGRWVDFFPYSSFPEGMGANCFLSLKSSPYYQKLSSCKIAPQIRLTRKFTECFTGQEMRQCSPTKATSERASAQSRYLLCHHQWSGRNRGKAGGCICSTYSYGTRTPQAESLLPRAPSPHLVREVKSQVAGTKGEADEAPPHAHLSNLQPFPGSP